MVTVRFMGSMYLYICSVFVSERQGNVKDEVHKGRVT